MIINNCEACLNPISLSQHALTSDTNCTSQYLLCKATWWLCQVAEQERTNREAGTEAELRRSIEASLIERVKQEKLNLSRKALELGKQKVS